MTPTVGEPAKTPSGGSAHSNTRSGTISANGIEAANHNGERPLSASA